MKTFLASLLFVGCLCRAADTPPPSTARSHSSTNAGTSTKYYVQLIRGSDQSTPPVPGAHLVGPKIQKQLDPVFRWKYYWEIQRSNISVEAGKTGRVNLTDGRSVVIDLQQPGKRTINLYRGKKLVHTAVCARDKEVCIQGIESTDGTPWFVVVRTDAPAT